DPGEQVAGALAREARRDRLDARGRHPAADQLVGQRLDLEAADVGGGELHLPLQVGELHPVVVAQQQAAGAGGAERVGHRAAEPAGADDGERGAGRHWAKYSSSEKYRSPVSHSTVTTRLPGPSSRAISAATNTLAPAEMPTRSPSSRASRLDTTSASRSSTVRRSVITERSRISGTKPAPMPWILCGPGGRPDKTALRAGSTPTTRHSGKRSRK